MTKNEQTEAGLAPKVETEAIHAWGLDYDDPDEFPTQPTRLTSRRITALGIAASLVVIAVCGAVAVGVGRHHREGVRVAAPVATVVVPPPTVTMTLPPPVTVTVQAAPPPPPSVAPPPPVVAKPEPSANEEKFIDATAALPFYVLPARILTNEALLKGGYRACKAMDNHPNDTGAAVSEYYPGGTQTNGTVDYNGHMFVLYAATYLCPRHTDMWADF